MIDLVYPQIEDGRVIADATVEELGEYFVGDRLRVWISGGERTAFVIPSTYVTTRFGIDYVQIRQGDRTIRRAGAARPRSADARASRTALKFCPAFAPATSWCSHESRPLRPADAGDHRLAADAAVPARLARRRPRRAGRRFRARRSRRSPCRWSTSTSTPTGCKAPDAVELVTKPLETIVKGIDGVEHVYCQTEDDRVMVTARFLVGTKSDDAILRVHEKIRANLDRIPVGIPEPLIVGRGIDDVAIIVLTLSPKPEAADRWTDKDLYALADKLRAEVAKVDNVGLTYISGGGAEQIRVEPDPEKLSLYGVTLQQLVAKVQDANRSFQAGQVRDAGIVRSVAAGQTLPEFPRSACC